MPATPMPILDIDYNSLNPRLHEYIDEDNLHPPRRPWFLGWSAMLLNEMRCRIAVFVFEPSPCGGLGPAEDRARWNVWDKVRKVRSSLEAPALLQPD